MFCRRCIIRKTAKNVITMPKRVRRGRSEMLREPSLRLGDSLSFDAKRNVECPFAETRVHTSRQTGTRTSGYR